MEIVLFPEFATKIRPLVESITIPHGLLNVPCVVVIVVGNPSEGFE